MNTSILIALKDSVSSRAAVEYLTRLPLCYDEVHVTLIHVFRKPISSPYASEDLMGETFVKEEPSRLRVVLEQAKERLVENGFHPAHIEIKLTEARYPTVTDGIIQEFKKGTFDMVVIGRKRKSKAEEFVMGDIGIKLVRALEGSAVLVVESK